MVSALRDANFIAHDAVDQSMLGGDSPRPVTVKSVPQRLGLSNTGVAISLNVFDECIDALDRAAVFSLPKEVVVPGIGIPHKSHRQKWRCQLVVGQRMLGAGSLFKASDGAE